MASGSLGALAESDLLLSYSSDTPDQRQATLERFRRANTIAAEALEAQERKIHPPQTELDLLAPKLVRGILPGRPPPDEKQLLEQVEKYENEARVNPLKLSTAQLVLASNPLRQPNHTTISFNHHQRQKPISYRVDPDIVRGSQRQFQTQLYYLLWGECQETDTEGVHPVVSSSKQAQDLFADLNVADVLLYGRTGKVPVSTTSNGGLNDTSTNRPSTSLRTSISTTRDSSSHRHNTSSTDTTSSTPPTVPVSPWQWFYMMKQNITNEKKLCRKVEFDHRHVVPEFENHENETPILGVGSALAAVGGQVKDLASQTSMNSPTGKKGINNKGFVKTCEIICERFRLDPTIEEEEAEEAQSQQIQLATDQLKSSDAPTAATIPSSSSLLSLSSSSRSASTSPTRSARTDPTTLPSPIQNDNSQVTTLRSAITRKSSFSMLSPKSPNKLTRMKIEEEDTTDYGYNGSSVEPSPAPSPLFPSIASDGSITSSPVNGPASMPTSAAATPGSTRRSFSILSPPGRPRLDASPVNGRNGNTSTVAPHPPTLMDHATTTATIAALSATPVTSAYDHFHHRMVIHGRTDPTQTKLDKLFFNKDDLRSFLRAPYGKGALLKFIISKSANCELIRATWIDKGPTTTEHNNKQYHQSHTSPSADPTSPFSTRQIKFLVQTRTNSFKLNDTGFSFYERTLTYPHPQDHRIEMNDLESEFNLKNIVGHVQRTAVYLKQRAKERQRKREEERKKRMANNNDRSITGRLSPTNNFNLERSPSPTPSDTATTTESNTSGAAAPSNTTNYDDPSTLIAQATNQHYVIRDYEPGSTLYNNLRGICDKLAAYFDIVLSSGPSPSNRRRTKKMQLYFRRDACNQLWLLWSDCLEFEDPTAAPVVPPTPPPPKQTRYGTDPIPNHASNSNSRSSPLVGKSQNLGSSIMSSMKISEEKEQEEDAAFSDGEEYESDGEGEKEDSTRSVKKKRDTTSHDSIEEQPSISFDLSLAGAEGEAGGDDAIDDDDVDGAGSWRALNRATRKRPTALIKPGDPSLAGEAPQAIGEDEFKENERLAIEEELAKMDRPPTPPALKKYPCSHCRSLTSKYDLYFLQLDTLLHTYDLEASSNGYFHQKKIEWTSMEWEEAPVSLAESKESARRESLVRQASRMSISTAADRERKNSLAVVAGAEPSSPHHGSRPGSARPSTTHATLTVPGSPSIVSATSLSPKGITPRPAPLNVTMSPKSNTVAAPLSPTTMAGHTKRSSILNGMNSPTLSSLSSSPQPSALSLDQLDPPPSFALFLDPTLTAKTWSIKKKDRAFLDSELGLCGKCIGRVWMDPLFVREKFGQSINPIQHTLANMKSLGSTDGSGSNEPTIQPNFAWLAKKNMSAYDRAHSNFASRIVSSDSDSDHDGNEDGQKSSSPSHKSKRHLPPNFISRNVQLARAGAYYVSSATRKSQRELSTSEGKDVYTCERAYSNRWSHYSEEKEDRDLASSLQGRMANEKSAQIYAVAASSRHASQLKPSEIERTYGLTVGWHGDPSGGYRSNHVTHRSHAATTRPGSSPIRFVSSATSRRQLSPSPSRRTSAGMPKLSPARVQSSSRSTRRSTSPSKLTSASSSPYGQPQSQHYQRHDQHIQQQQDLALGFGGGDLVDDDGAGLTPLKKSRSSSKSPVKTSLDKDTTFLTSVDGDNPDPLAGVGALELDELLTGVIRPKPSPVEAAAPSLGFTSNSTSMPSTTPTKTSDSSSKKNASAYGGSRMEERIALKAEKRAERDQKQAETTRAEQEAAAKSTCRRRSAPLSTLLPPTVIPGHEPLHPLLTTIYDRPLTAHTRRPPNRPIHVMDRELRDQTWQRVHGLLNQRHQLERNESEKRLEFKPPTEAPNAFVFNPSSNQTNVNEERRKQKAEIYRTIRRSSTVTHLRSDNDGPPKTEEEKQQSSSTSSSSIDHPSKVNRLSHSRSNLLTPLKSKEKVSLTVQRATEAYSPQRKTKIDGVTPNKRRSATSAERKLRMDDSSVAGGLPADSTVTDASLAIASSSSSPVRSRVASATKSRPSPGASTSPSRATSASKSRPVSSSTEKRLNLLESLYRTTPASSNVYGPQLDQTPANQSTSPSRVPKPSTLHIIAMPPFDPKKEPGIPLTKQQQLMIALGQSQTPTKSTKKKNITDVLKEASPAKSDMSSNFPPVPPVTTIASEASPAVVDGVNVSDSQQLLLMDVSIVAPIQAAGPKEQNPPMIPPANDSGAKQSDVQQTSSSADSTTLTQGSLVPTIADTTNDSPTTELSSSTTFSPSTASPPPPMTSSSSSTNSIPSHQSPLMTPPTNNSSNSIQSSSIQSTLRTVIHRQPIGMSSLETIGYNSSAD